MNDAVPSDSRTVVTVNQYGFHARTSMWFVDLANMFDSEIVLTTGGHVVDGKSIMCIMSCSECRPGQEFKVTAYGRDCRDAVHALAKFVQEGFGEYCP